MTLAWLDYSEAERRRMHEVINLFREHGILDELGAGTVRDALADLFFPGTSTIQTRARYLLFIPWIYQQIEHEEVPSSKVAARARSDEITLITGLDRGGEKSSGTIGIDAREHLQRLPSSIYWQGLWILGIRRFSGSVDKFHRSLDAYYRAIRREPKSEEGEPSSAPVPPNWHATLPSPPNKRWKNSITFTLPEAEAEYLRERIVTQAPGTLFAEVLERCRSLEGISAPWELQELHRFPPNLRNQVRHAENFSLAMHGATLTYNVRLARLTNLNTELDRYLDVLSAWADDMQAAQDRFANWDRAEFWAIVRRINPRISFATEAFVEAWLRHALLDPHSVADSDAVGELLTSREHRIKGSLARLANPRARETWRGAPQLSPMTFRWRDAGRIISDIWAGLRKPGGDLVA